jgi:hypothetical protein
VTGVDERLEGPVPPGLVAEHRHAHSRVPFRDRGTNITTNVLGEALLS